MREVISFVKGGKKHIQMEVSGTNPVFQIIGFIVWHSGGKLPIVSEERSCSRNSMHKTKETEDVNSEQQTISCQL